MIHSIKKLSVSADALWIAFSSLTLLMIHSFVSKKKHLSPVVNCFQFINFVNDSQSNIMYDGIDASCELLSVH